MRRLRERFNTEGIRLSSHEVRPQGSEQVVSGDTSATAETDSLYDNLESTMHRTSIVLAGLNRERSVLEAVLASVPASRARRGEEHSDPVGSADASGSTGRTARPQYPRRVGQGHASEGGPRLGRLDSWDEEGDEPGNSHHAVRAGFSPRGQRHFTRPPVPSRANPIDLMLELWLDESCPRHTQDGAALDLDTKTPEQAAAVLQRGIEGESNVYAEGGQTQLPGEATPTQPSSPRGEDDEPTQEGTTS